MGFGLRGLLRRHSFIKVLKKKKKKSILPIKGLNSDFINFVEFRMLNLLYFPLKAYGFPWSMRIDFVLNSYFMQKWTSVNFYKNLYSLYVGSFEHLDFLVGKKIVSVKQFWSPIDFLSVFGYN